MSADACTGDCATCVAQPDQSKLHVADGIGIMLLAFPDAGTVVPQHVHAYDHVTMVATGGVRLLVGGEDRGEYRAPHALTIAAGIAHTFETIEPATTLYCIHNVARSGAVEIAAVVSPAGGN